MANTKDYVVTEGNTKTTITYSCEPKDMQYTIMGQDIKNDFNFLRLAIPRLLDEAMKNLNSAASISDAFYVEGNAKFNDLIHVHDELKKDVENLKENLNTLYNRYMTSIDNVNAELENNFGHWAFCKVNEAGRKVETIEDSE